MCTFARRSAAALSIVLLLPAAAFAQAAITGVVKDPSGAVLPGVTVEAASPDLIEKVRSVVSDDTGQYRIVDLRPGIYRVVFTLQGVRILGAEGVASEGEWPTLFLTAPSMSIRGGTDEIQRNIVGERVLGLPGDVRVDRDVPFDHIPR